jgi:hypothetical protein
MRVTEREITAEVELCRPDGTLNPDAVGWTRHPLHDTSRIGRGRRGWGRAKRWEYWAVTTPTHLIGVTVSSLDYAGVYAVWVHDRRSGETVSHDVIDPLARGASLPARLGDDPARASAGGLTIAIEAASGGTRLTVDGPRGAARRPCAAPRRPRGHGSRRAVVGTAVPVDGQGRRAPGAGAVCGSTGWNTPSPTVTRGRCSTTAGVVGRMPFTGTGVPGRVSSMVGSSGCRSAGAGPTAPARPRTRSSSTAGCTRSARSCPGRYDTRDWLAPWRVRGDLADLTFTPFWNHSSATNLGILAQRANQCFGHWSGWMRDDAGEPVSVDGVLGWAEDVHNRW